MAYMRPNHRVLTAACLLSGLPALSLASEEPPPLPLQMDVRLNLFSHTYPRFRYSADGPLLYPGYCDLAGVIHFSGSPVFTAPLSQQLTAAQNDSSAIAKLLHLHVARLVDGSAVEVTQASQTVTAKSAKEYEWTFTILVSDRKVWPDGRYRLQMGVSYLAAQTERSLDVDPLPFEIRTLLKDTGDEINLLTNAALNVPDGFRMALLQREPGLSGTKLYERILKLEPNDAFARNALAVEAMSDGRPADALSQYHRLRTDFESGRATRVESLVWNPHPLRSCDIVQVPDRQQLEPVVREKVDQARAVTEDYQKAEADVNSALADASVAKLQDLLNSQKRWVPLVAVRAVGQRRLQAGESILIGQLRTSPPRMQQEIVNALALIRRNEKTCSSTMPSDVLA
jgi:hypothetical protein